MTLVHLSMGVFRAQDDLAGSSRQPSASLRERFALVSYMTSLSYPCDMAHLRMTSILDGATLG
jgi:hypothetical protein